MHIYWMFVQVTITIQMQHIPAIALNGLVVVYGLYESMFTQSRLLMNLIRLDVRNRFGQIMNEKCNLNSSERYLLYAVLHERICTIAHQILTHSWSWYVQTIDERFDAGIFHLFVIR